MEVDTTGMFWVQKYRFNIEWGERGDENQHFCGNFEKCLKSFVHDCLETLFGGSMHILGDSGLFFTGIITFIPTQLFVKHLFISMTTACFVHIFVNFATTQFIDVCGQNMYILLLFVIILCTSI